MEIQLHFSILMASAVDLMDVLILQDVQGSLTFLKIILL